MPVVSLAMQVILIHLKPRAWNDALLVRLLHVAPALLTGKTFTLGQKRTSTRLPVTPAGMSTCLPEISATRLVEPDH
jgi:hypothetical protein